MLMRVTLRELRVIIQRKLREDLFTKGMHTAPTSTGHDREQLKDLTRSEDNNEEMASHLLYSEEDPEEHFGPVPPGNPDEMAGMSVGSDPYTRDWAAINSIGVSR